MLLYVLHVPITVQTSDLTFCVENLINLMFTFNVYSLNVKNEKYLQPIFPFYNVTQVLPQKIFPKEESHYTLKLKPKVRICGDFSTKWWNRKSKLSAPECTTKDHPQSQERKIDGNNKRFDGLRTEYKSALTLLTLLNIIVHIHLQKGTESLDTHEETLLGTLSEGGYLPINYLKK